MNSNPELDHAAPIPVEDDGGASRTAYPRERIPKHAILSAASLLERSRCDVPAIDDAADVRYVNRGCMAIGLALEHAGIGAGDEVLLPAYHCISMIEPVAWRNARPVFYRIRPDTSVDLDDLRTRMTPRTRALLVAHYFGFLQDLVAVRAFCDEHSLVLIEDCAHAFFGSAGGIPVGSTGDYAIASAWKFFPVPDGGVLISGRRSLDGIELESGNCRFQAKAIVNTLEMAFEYRRMNVLRVLLRGPLELKDTMLRMIRRTRPIQAEPARLSHRLGGWGFDAALVKRKMSISSRWILKRASRQRIVEGRRKNYTTMTTELGQLPECRPLFAELPVGIVPQVFPLIVDAPERVFPALRKAGVPVIRFGEYLWEGMAPQTCPVSADLSRRVFQLPCHQELGASEIDWMLCEVRSAVLRG